MISQIQNSIARGLLVGFAFMACMVPTVEAADSDYNDAYRYAASTNGLPDERWIYWAAYEDNPTWENWDRYQGYRNGRNDLTGTRTEYSESARWEFIGFVVDAVTSQQQTVQGTQRIAQGSNMTVQSVSRSRARAGDGAVDPTVQLDLSYASIEDQRLNSWANGTDVVGSLLYSGALGDSTSWGLGYAHNQYKVRSLAWTEDVDYFDMYLSYHISPDLSFGVFLDFSHTDFDGDFSQTSIPDGEFDRWGGGLTSSYGFDLSDFIRLGLTGVLSSMNKSSIGAFGDDEDSAGFLMADSTFWLSDALSFTAYGSYFALLDRETGPGIDSMDGSYFTYGGEFALKASASLSFTVGYETIAGDNYRREDRANAGLTISF